MSENFRKNEEEKPVLVLVVDNVAEGLMRSKENIARFFDINKDKLAEEIERIISDLDAWIKSDFLPGQNIKESLRQCSNIKNREKFIEDMLVALKPIFDFKRNDPLNFEIIERKDYDEYSGYKRVNDLIYYDTIDSKIAIHIAHSRYIKGKKSLLLDGLAELARMVESSRDIDKIEGESWIIARKPKLVEKLGFTLEDIAIESPEMPGVPIRRAYMSREDFLKKYLK